MEHPFHLRVARPVSDIARSCDRYRRALGLVVVGSFEDHDGFDGVMLGVPGAQWHFEFTRFRRHPVRPAPTVEDLVVLYLPDERAWLAACGRMTAAGFKQVAAFNPSWEGQGRSFEDDDGYRTVLQQGAWLSQRARGRNWWRRRESMSGCCRTKVHLLRPSPDLRYPVGTPNDKSNH